MESNNLTTHNRQFSFSYCTYCNCRLYTVSSVCLMYSFCCFYIFLYSLNCSFSFYNYNNFLSIDYSYSLRYGVITVSLSNVAELYLSLFELSKLLLLSLLFTDLPCYLWSFFTSTPISLRIYYPRMSSLYYNSASKNDRTLLPDSSSFFVNFLSYTSVKFL